MGNPLDGLFGGVRRVLLDGTEKPFHPALNLIAPGAEITEGVDGDGNPTVDVDLSAIASASIEAGDGIDNTGGTLSVDVADPTLVVGVTGLKRAPISGDVVIPAGSNSATISTGAIDETKLASDVGRIFEVDVLITSTDTLSGTTARDGVTLTAGSSRALYIVNGSTDGVYTVQAGAWTRAPELDTNSDCRVGKMWTVKAGGTAGAGQSYRLKAGNTLTTLLFERADAAPHYGVEIARAPFNIIGRAVTPGLYNYTDEFKEAYQVCVARSPLGAPIKLPVGAQHFDKPLVAGDWFKSEGAPCCSSIIDGTFKGGPLIILGPNTAWPTTTAIEGGGSNLSLVMPGNDNANKRGLDLSYGGFLIDTDWTQFSYEGFFYVNALESETRALIDYGGRRVGTHTYDQCFKVSVTPSGRIEFKLRVGGVVETLLSAASSVTAAANQFVSCEYDGTTMRIWVGAPGATLALSSSLVVTNPGGVIRAKKYESCHIGHAFNDSYFGDENIGHPIAGKLGSFRVGNAALRGTGSIAPAPSTTLGQAGSTKCRFVPHTDNIEDHIVKFFVDGSTSFAFKRGVGTTGAGNVIIKDISFYGSNKISGIYGNNAIRCLIDRCRFEVGGGGVWLDNLSYESTISNPIYIQAGRFPCLAFTKSFASIMGSLTMQAGVYGLLINSCYVKQHGAMYIAGTNEIDCYVIGESIARSTFADLQFADEGGPVDYCGMLLRLSPSGPEAGMTDINGNFELFTSGKPPIIIAPGSVPKEQLVLSGRSRAATGAPCHVYYEGSAAEVEAMPPIRTREINWNNNAGIPITNKPGHVILNGPLFKDDTGPIVRTAQTASIAASDIFNANPVAGQYAVHCYLTCTTAGTGGTVQVHISGTDGGGAHAEDSPTLALNALGRLKFSCVMDLDGLNTFRYATTVSSATGSPQYSLKIIVARIDV